VVAGGFAAVSVSAIQTHLSVGSGFSIRVVLNERAFLAGVYPPSPDANQHSFSFRHALDWWFESPFRLWSLFFCTSWLFMLVAGNGLLIRLKGLRGMTWSPREDSRESPLAKSSVPSMGGVGLIGSAVLAYTAIMSALLALDAFTARFYPNELNQDVQIFGFPIFVSAIAGVGWAGEWSKATGRGGLRARTKLALQGLFTLAFLLLELSTKEIALQPFEFLSIGIFIILALVVFAASNAVYFTDGIDGLVAGLILELGVAAIALAYWLREQSLGVRTPMEVPIFWASLSGASLGFLAFNRHPARVVLGDTGSLALGAALGAGAVALRAVFLLPFIGFIFWLELLSVMLQFAGFKFTRERFGEGPHVFRRARLHHYFEMEGWSEWRIAITFWGFNAVTSTVGLILWWRGDLPRFP